MGILVVRPGGAAVRRRPCQAGPTRLARIGERLLLQGKVERADAGRAVLLRALQQAEKALEIEEVDLALRTIRSALYDE